MMDEAGNSIIHCSGCGATLPDSIFNAPAPVKCERCGNELLVTVFPALARGHGPVDYGDSLQADSEASCFYHPEKRAVIACESCGRFLCSLCEIDMTDRKICPNCFELGRSRERITELIAKRTLYDRIALSLAVLPLLIFYLTVFTAPMAIYISIRHWRTPASIVGRTKVRFVLAILISLAEIGGWTVALPRFWKLMSHI